jgi:hypothetical protein
MSDVITTEMGFQELARRATGCMDVALLWRRVDGRLRVTVSDCSGDRFVVEANRERALEAYYHPFAQAGLHLVEP